MPPQFLFDISAIDLNHVLLDRKALEQYIPQRGSMAMLDGIVYLDPPAHNVIGFKDIRADEFWVEGHIPGRPLFPGVLMIEAAAQLASYYARGHLGWTGFIGFAGVEECRFRQAVTPPCRLYLVATLLWTRHRRICSRQQGVVDGTIVFETTIIGSQM
jgi:3-hydroxyacyl-[acyl-carrier-protein] dehydratase